MLQIATKHEIENRVNGINLTLRRLASKAGVDPMTAYRGAKRVTTLSAMTRALEHEEIRVLRHLLTLPHVREALAEPPSSADSNGATA